MLSLCDFDAVIGVVVLTLQVGQLYGSASFMSGMGSRSRVP